MKLIATKRIILDFQTLDEILHDCKENDPFEVAEAFFEDNELIYNDRNLVTLFGRIVGYQNTKTTFHPIVYYFTAEVDVKINQKFYTAYHVAKTPELTTYAAIRRALLLTVNGDFLFDDDAVSEVYEEMRKQKEL